MLKHTFETKTQELKTWVDPSNGSLNVQIGKETVSVPHEVSLELISAIKQKQTIYREIERKKNSSWGKIIEVFSGQKRFCAWEDV